MSLKLVTIAWCQHLPPTAKLILLALSDMASDDGACHPTIDRLADVCGVVRLTVLNNLKALENAGVIVIERRPGRCSGYRVTLGGTA